MLAILRRNSGTLPISNPISVEIHPTNICNYNCKYCSYTIRRSDMKSIKQTVLMDLCRDLIEMQVQTVFFSGGGEPTMYNYLYEAMTLLYENGINLALLTNGSNIEVIKKIAHYCQYILVHISSHDSKIYRDLMGHEQHSIINFAKNVREVTKKTHIGARIVVVNKNMEFLYETVDCLLKHGFDYVQCTPATDYESRGVTIDWTKLEDIFSHPIFEKPNVMKAYKVGQKNPYRVSSKCASIENRLHAIIDAKGGVYICPPYTSEGDKFCLGNINEKRFVNIWNSEQHKKVIHTMNEHYKNHDCKYCRFIEYNAFYDNMDKTLHNPHAFFL